MRCRNAYLVWRELPAAVGLLGSEGKKAKSAGGPNKQIQQEATQFQANIGYWSMDDDYKSNYLESSTAGGRYGLEKFRVPKVCSERWV